MPKTLAEKFYKLILMKLLKKLDRLYVAKFL